MTKRLTITPILLMVFFIFGAVFLFLRFFYFNKISAFQLMPVKITIIEGYNLKDIADKLAPFKNFDENNFLKIAPEGYLFPDTYFLTGGEDEIEIINIMQSNFQKKVGEISKENLIMASILEREVKTFDDKKIVAGILWKRLNAGIPLQVDAEPDTYIYKELPLAPICNPGLESINAALNPVDSLYWFYISDKKGNTHFAKTFEEHQRNIAKYLTK
jgi:UPF0755 protein